MNTKILQIVSADRWDAAFESQNGARVPLVAWALVQETDGSTCIKGIIPASWQKMQFCEDLEEFICYVPQGIAVPGHSSGK